jgi:hypothetical protein
MISHLFLPFLFIKVVVFDLLTLENDSATHNIVGVVHGNFLLDFSFEVEISQYNLFNWWAKILFSAQS